jgi:hypothetical protein
MEGLAYAPNCARGVGVQGGYGGLESGKCSFAVSVKPWFVPDVTAATTAALLHAGSMRTRFDNRYQGGAIHV